jgi:acetyl esterase/lipase
MQHPESRDPPKTSDLTRIRVSRRRVASGQLHAATWSYFPIVPGDCTTLVVWFDGGQRGQPESSDSACRTHSARQGTLVVRADCRSIAGLTFGENGRLGYEIVSFAAEQARSVGAAPSRTRIVGSSQAAMIAVAAALRAGAAQFAPPVEKLYLVRPAIVHTFPGAAAMTLPIRWLANDASTALSNPYLQRQLAPGESFEFLGGLPPLTGLPPIVLTLLADDPGVAAVSELARTIDEVGGSVTMRFTDRAPRPFDDLHVN